MTSTYSSLQRERQLLEVGSDDMNILIYDRKSRIKAIGTRALNGCTCVVILGQSAIILAHMSPYPGIFDENTRQDVVQLSYQHHESSLAAVRSLMKLHLEHFPPPSTAWGVFATNEKSGAVRSIINQVRDCLRALSLDMNCAQYDQEAEISNIIPPKGELVSFFENAKPRLIMEGRQLWLSRTDSAQPSAAGSSRQPEPLSATTSSRTSQVWARYPIRNTNEGATLLSCVMSGKALELAATWPQGVRNLPLVWIRNSWLQTEKSAKDDVLLVRGPDGELVRIERPTAGT